MLLSQVMASWLIIVQTLSAAHTLSHAESLLLERAA
jgi:hypothetical protein